jgi:hypothetical protein
MVTKNLSKNCLVDFGYGAFGSLKETIWVLIFLNDVFKDPQVMTKNPTLN